MYKPTRRINLAAVPFALMATMISSAIMADETDAKRILKAMSDYLDSQQAYSFEYDSVLEVVTDDGQIIGLASSGETSASRPDKIFASRHGGFANVEMSFDGQTLTILGKDVNKYAQLDMPGTTDNLIDQLKNTYHVPLPAADLLLSNASEILLQDVVDVKDLGSGVVNGIECDSLAFRTEEVDWQIWIAQGETPFPCRYVITSKLITNGPQYTVQTSNWKTGKDVAERDFAFKNTSNAEKVELDNLPDAKHLPDNFVAKKGAAE
jgi:hypothetical protein